MGSYICKADLSVFIHQLLGRFNNDLPVNTIHTFGNNSDQPCKWINIHSPKGFWSFFRDMGVDSEEENAVMKSVDESIIRKVMATAADYDMVIDV